MAPCVYVIDDSALDRQFLSRALTELPIDIRLFDSAERALALSADERPIAVIVDVFMPRMDGLETIRAFRRKGFDRLIVAISNGGQLGDLDALRYARAFGADHVEPKPVDADRLATLIRTELSRKDPPTAGRPPT